MLTPERLRSMREQITEKILTGGPEVLQADGSTISISKLYPEMLESWHHQILTLDKLLEENSAELRKASDDVLHFGNGSVFIDESGKVKHVPLGEIYGRSPATDLLPKIKKDNIGRRGDLKILDAKNYLTSIVHEDLGSNFNQEEIMHEAEEVKEELRNIQNTLFRINLRDPRAVAKHQEKIAELAGYLLDLLMASRRAVRS